MIHVDRRRFHEVFSKIFEAYVHRTHLFALYDAENTAPQAVSIPRGLKFGEPKHLYWGTQIVMCDTRTTSATLYPRFAKMFSRNPRLFIPGVYPSERRMTELFETYQIALPRYQVKLFLTRKRHLDGVFGGDPLAIYKGVGSIDELMDKFELLKREHGIANLFPGAKRKVFTLLAMFLSEFSPDFEFKEKVAVDVHVQNISNSTHALEGQGRIDIVTLEAAIRPHMSDTFVSFAHHFGAASATWILGSKGCSNCHRTDMRKLCPIYQECEGPILRMRHPTSGKLYGRIERPFTLRGKYIPIIHVS